MKKIILIILICSLTYSFISAGHRSIESRPRYSDKIIVQYRENITGDDINLFNQKHNINLQGKQEMITYIENAHHLARIKKYLTNLPFSVYQLTAADKNNLESIVKDISSENIVLFAQPDHFVYALQSYIPPYAPLPAGPNDTYYTVNNSSVEGCQWGFHQVQADTAFGSGLIDPNKNKTIIVAELDTGVLFTHVDLAGRTITGMNIINPAAQPLDDDIGNGDGGHGTHVAGIIAANTNNGMGIAGTAYLNATSIAKILVMPVKVLDSTGSGYETDIISGIHWAVDNGANVLNYSLGEDQGDDALQGAINYAYNKGCINVAAAGNGDDNGNPVNTSYPAAYPNVIAVAATADQYDNPASWSNEGKIDVAAPGVQIMSCDATNNTYYSGDSNCDGGAEMDGTSFSTPFVSGLAALLLLKYDNLTPDQVINIIEQSADSSSGYNTRTGWGRINVYRALSLNLNTLSSSNSSGITTYNWPNPFSPVKDAFTRITFVPMSQAPVNIKIYDGGGALVWSTNLQASDLIIGTYNFVQWNGTNSSGKKVANGTYFYTVQSQGNYGKNKIAVIY